MYISRLLAKGYRNLKAVDISLGKGVNILYGNNAQGKTNILEAMYICATGRSHRTHNDRELIAFGGEDAHVQAYIAEGSRTDKIDLHIKKNEKKGIAVNNIPISRLIELYGILHIVMFSPEDLKLVKSSPADRRRFMDMELCQLSRVYYYNVQQYHKIMKQRNNLLKSIQGNKALSDTLFIWDEQLVDYGNKVINVRNEFITKLHIISEKIHHEITGTDENLAVKYSPSVQSSEFEQKLRKNHDRDIFLGSTGCGPHKDELNFYINDINVKEYGSQGQQRCAALALKLAEIELIRTEKGRQPVLLLDDVLSELDTRRQSFLVDSIKDIQTVITCTGIDDILKKFNTANVIRVHDGTAVDIRQLKK